MYFFLGEIFGMATAENIGLNLESAGTISIAKGSCLGQRLGDWIVFTPVLKLWDLTWSWYAVGLVPVQESSMTQRHTDLGTKREK